MYADNRPLETMMIDQYVLHSNAYRLRLVMLRLLNTYMLMDISTD